MENISRDSGCTPDLGDRLAQIPAEHLLLLQELQLRNANFTIAKLQAENEKLKSSKASLRRSQIRWEDDRRRHRNHEHYRNIRSRLP
jgi:hypothetical protein